MTSRRRERTTMLALALSGIVVAALAGSLAIPATPVDQPPGSTGPTAASSAVPSPSALRPEDVSHRPTEVFGFLPYWSMADWTDAYLRYDLLTTIAFFGVGVHQNGSLVLSGPGFEALRSARGATIIDHAHAAGVRVVITFEAFGEARNHALLASAKARSAFVTQAAAFVSEHGLDGLDLDMEGLAAADRPAFGQLVGALATAVHGADPAAEVSVATNANVSGARMAQVALAAGADRAFLMGYAYRVAASATAGAIAPLTGVGTTLDLVQSLDLYAANAVPPERVILGLPYYGMTWPTVDGEPHAARQPASAGLGSGRAFRPRTIVATGPPADSFLDYDLVEQAARLTWYDPTLHSWFETYYDDPTTLAPKEHLAVERGLAGIGIWALGDDAGQPGYWETISTTLGLGSPGGSAAPGSSAAPSGSPSAGASPSASPGATPDGLPSPASGGPTPSPTAPSVGPTPTIMPCPTVLCG